MTFMFTALMFIGWVIRLGLGVLQIMGLVLLFTSGIASGLKLIALGFIGYITTNIIQNKIELIMAKRHRET